jgi:hypothetical protein
MKLFFFAGGSIVYALCVVVAGRFLKLVRTPPTPTPEKPSATSNIRRSA